MQKNVLPISPHRAVRLLVASLLFCLCTGFIAHQINVKPNTPVADNWVYHKTVNGVELYHQLTSCNSKTVVLLKFNNKNSHKVKVSWKEVFTTQLEKSVEGYNGKKQLFIGPGETFSSGCQDDKIKELLILPQQVKPTYEASIKAFEFKDIDVTPAL